MTSKLSRVFSKLVTLSNSKPGSVLSANTVHTNSNFTGEDERYSAYDIGSWTYGKPRVLTWDESTKLKIGRFCSIAEQVVILLGAEHRKDWVTTYPFNVFFEDARDITGHPSSKGDVIIENDVWIGTQALILSGVTIGNGSVIAARSVVTKDVAPYSLVGGNPARIIRMRFSDSQISALLKIAWWNWPLDKIKEAIPLLLAPDIDLFIEKYK